MKLSLGARLMLSTLVVILTGMAIVTPLAWLAVEQLYRNTQSSSLLAQARLVASALENNPPPTSLTSSYSQSSNMQPGIHTRVLDAQGAAVIDLSFSRPTSATGDLLLPQLAQNGANPVSADELLNRSEISAARAGQAATAVRTIGMDGGQPVLYAAAPVFGPDGSVVQVVYLATPLPDTRFSALPANVRWLFGGVLMVAVCLAGLAGTLLAGRVTGPLAKLASAAHAVAAGDLQQTVPVDGNIEELAVLGQAFNQMTANLRQADQVKTSFISDVTHELRTPLTVIKGTLETLQDGAINDLDARGPFLLSMGRETERLIRLVNDLLVLTRADARALNLQFQAVNLAELALTRCSLLTPLAEQRQVSLSVRPEAPPEQAMVRGDSDRLSQVLDNLLNNALRYAPAHSQVTVSLTHENGEVICQVCDSGTGIAAEHLPLIFERFYRVDAGRSRMAGGSGLGLAIVRSLVQAQGGQVNVSSTKDRGTIFTVRLPAVDP